MYHYCFFICCLFFAASVFCQTPFLVGFNLPEEVRYISVPIKVRHNLILVPLQINGSFTMDFILDTGVQYTFLTDSILCDLLSLRVNRELFVQGLGGKGSIKAGVAGGALIEIGEARFSHASIVVLPSGVLSFSEIFACPVHGVIGYDLFRDFVVEIDYLSSRLKLYRRDKFRAGRNWSVLPLSIRGGKPYLQVNAVGNNGDAHLMDLLLDTGSSQALLLPWNSLSLPKRTLPAFLGRGLSGHIDGVVGYIDSLRFGKYCFARPLACFPDSSAIVLSDSVQLAWTGSIGGEIWHRFRVILDYEGGKIYLKKNARYGSKFLYNRSGIEIITSGAAYRNYYASAVRMGSSASLAGVEVGDEILSVNGQDLSELEIESIYPLLEGRNGRFLRLKVLHNGQIRSIRFKLQEDL